MDEASRNLVKHKVKTVQEIAAIIDPLPRQKKVIMCHGTFDIVDDQTTQRSFSKRIFSELLALDRRA